MTALTGSLAWIVFLYIGNYLLGTIKADSIQDEQGAEEYLRIFGYFGNLEHTADALMGEDAFTNALKDFQRFSGLNPTGVLDDATIVMMNTPRCVVPDTIEDSPSVRRKRYALASKNKCLLPNLTETVSNRNRMINVEHRSSNISITEKPAAWWKETDLTYKITKYHQKLNSTLIDNEIRKAFEFWSNVTLLKFTQKKRGRVNIPISFERGRHGDRDHFDGPGGRMSHSYFPLDGGNIHFDDEELWTINEEGGVDLLYVAVHAIGHSLGILHSDVREAIMYPYYNGSKMVRLHEDDIQAIQTLYGARESPARNIEDDISGPMPDAPDLCTNGVIDTITRTQDGSTYVFRGDFYWRITQDGIADVYPRIIIEDWIGLEENLDASITWTNDKTYFFKGGRYWRFTNKYMDRGYPKLLTQGFEGIPDMLDAAFRWSGDGKTYFFKGDEYWCYDDHNDPPVSDIYPQKINYWNGLPNNIDAAFEYENSKIYFFKDDKYYEFDDKLFKVKESPDDPFPRSTALKWLNCSS